MTTPHRLTAWIGALFFAALLGFTVLPSAGEEARVASEAPAAEGPVAGSGSESLEGVRDGAILSLETETPEEGFQLAIALARKGVTETQPDTEVLHSLRPEYSEDFDALIASSHVVAVHFRTVAEANGYWR